MHRRHFARIAAAALVLTVALAACDGPMGPEGPPVRRGRRARPDPRDHRGRKGTPDPRARRDSRARRDRRARRGRRARRDRRARSTGSITRGNSDRAGR